MTKSSPKIETLYRAAFDHRGQVIVESQEFRVFPASWKTLPGEYGKAAFEYRTTFYKCPGHATEREALADLVKRCLAVCDLFREDLNDAINRYGKAAAALAVAAGKDPA